MTVIPGNKFSGRSYSPAEHAKPLAVILGEEFQTLFVFQEVATGALVGDNPTPLPPVDLITIKHITTAGQCRVTRREAGYQITLPLYFGCKPILVASGLVLSLTAFGAECGQEQRRLEKWAQSVCERLRSSDYIVHRAGDQRDEPIPNRTPWEALLSLDRLLSQLRLHKSSAGNYSAILQAAFELLDVEAVLLVPTQPHELVLIHGETTMTPSESRQLVQMIGHDRQLLTTGRVRNNDVVATSWGNRFPTLANLIAIDGKDRLGTVLAINKRSPSPTTNGSEGASFRTADLALLSVFTSLLTLQARTVDRFSDLKDLLVGLTRSLTAALDARDTYTCGHSERVARIAVEISSELGMSPEQLNRVYLVGLLHDIGKIGVRDSVLWKEGPLTPEERLHMETHVEIGHTILSEVQQLQDILPGVLHHHERYDGAGYPHRLLGEDIPLLGRILAVADAFDAMSTSRPYRAGMQPARVEQILKEGAGSQWDRRIVEALFRRSEAIYAIRQRGVGESLRRALDGAAEKGRRPQSLPVVPEEGVVPPGT